MYNEYLREIHDMPITDGPPAPIDGNYPENPQVGQVWYDDVYRQTVRYSNSGWLILGSSRYRLASHTVVLLDRIDDAITTGGGGIMEMADKYPLVAEALKQLEVAIKLSSNLDNGG